MTGMHLVTAVGREGTTMASRQELGDQNSTRTGNSEEQRRVFALRELCSFSVFSCLLLCKATTKHAYDGARPQDVPTPSASNAGTTTRRPRWILGRRYVRATATTTQCSWRSCKRLNQTCSNKLNAMQCTKANLGNASDLQMLPTTAGWEGNVIFKMVYNSSA
jgi:hypothetical protein